MSCPLLSYFKVLSQHGTKPGEPESGKCLTPHTRDTALNYRLQISSFRKICQVYFVVCF
jgi:hypothetical protein